ncbi:TPA: autotransporter outer membrane beta-barrel domain-containing protein [Pseudomonas putida]|nr:autotransporter outer membrane beta-barrel domain-containing protein [Pseudomonas putida]
MRCFLFKPHSLAAGISLACMAFSTVHAASIELGDGQLSLKNLSLSTKDDREPVLLVNGAQARANITDSVFSTTGADSYAVQVRAGEAVLSGLTLSTTGASASAVVANGDSSQVSMINSRVLTTSGNAYGAEANRGAQLALDAVEINTQGTGARGVNVIADSGVGVLNSLISTQGIGADGLYVRGLSDQQRSSANVLESVIQTTGDNAKGVNANRDSQVALQRTRIGTSGQNAHGIWAAGGTSLVLANDVSISTLGDKSNGAMAQSGAAIDLQQGSIETFGQNAHGLYADAGSLLTARDTRVQTQGMSAGVFAVGDGTRIDLNNVAINTGGRGIGIVGYGMSRVQAQGLTLNADGAGVRGMLLQDSAGVSLLDSRVQVAGEGSVGVRSVSQAGQINSLQLLGSHISAQNTALDVAGGLRLELIDSGISGQRLLHTTARELSDGSVVDQERVSVAAIGSTLNGDILIDAQQVELTLHEHSGLYGTVSGLQHLTLDNSLWITPGDSSVGTLNLDNGVVVFEPSLSGAFKTLTVNNDLTGSGSFHLNTDLSTLRGDLLQVNGQVSGNHTLVIEDSGLDPSGPGQQLRVVDGAGGSGVFDLYAGHVDAGAYRYTLAQSGDDWFLKNSASIVPPVDPDTPIDPGQPPVVAVTGPADLSKGANAAIASQTAGATLWSAQMNALVKRLGELRMGKDEGGIWTRGIGRRFEVGEHSSRAFTQNVTGVEVGADKAFALGAGKLYVGGVVGGAHSDMNFGEGASGEVDSRMIGTYATYLHDNGVYVDTVAKYSHFDNEIKTPTNLGNPVRGSYTNQGVGMDVEIGRHIQLRQGWFVEPQVEITATHTTGGDYTATNGLRVDADDMHSLQSRVGSLFGRNMTLENGIEVQPYAKASWITEHAGASTVRVNDNRIKAEVPGDRLELGFGGVVQVGERSKIALDAEFAKGHDIKQPWGVTLGYRYLW